MSIEIPPVLWHGTESEPFDRFDQERVGPWKFGFWFSDDRDFAELFGDNQASVEVSVTRPFVIGCEKWNRIRDAHHGDPAWFDRWRSKLESEGYDSLMVEAKEEAVGRFTVRTPAIFAVFDASRVRILEWNPAPEASPGL